MLDSSLVAILDSDTLADAARRALGTWVVAVEAHAACLLLWDAELGRFIVGETFAQNADSAETRRKMLSFANGLAEPWQQAPGFIREGVIFQPLVIHTAPVGALLGETMGQVAACNELFAQVTSRTLYNLQRLERADQQQAQIQADHQRLEALLQAVEQQQRLIDQLLSAEREFSTRLEAQVAERTADLEAAQQQLIHSEKMATIGELAGHLAHEINNPLQAIRSGLDLVLVELAHQPTQQEYLQIIRAELERIEAIFRQMLDLQHPAQPHYTSLNLNQVCHSIAILMQKRFDAAHIQFLLRLEHAVPPICGDANQLKQVLINLLLNAIDAIPPTGGTIILETQAAESHLHLRVLDDGQGVAEVHRKQLFQPLFTTKTHGFGLGLAICQEIIQQHNGQITLQDDARFTIFSVRFPIQEDCHDDISSIDCG